MFAADLLFVFPYSGAIVIPSSPFRVADRHVFSFYAEWFFLTIFITWLFVFVSMSVPDEEAALHLNWMGRRFGNLSHSQRTWKNSLAWNSVVAIALAGPLTFDIVLHYRPLLRLEGEEE